MDKIDKKIIALLQKNGRISLTELSEAVNISLSPCQRRVKSLEQSGVINGYQANINPSKVGLGFAAIIFVTLKEMASDGVNKFENALSDIPEIVQAQRLFGDPDYMLHIVTKDLDSFQKLYDHKLSALPNVSRLRSTLVMKNVLSDRTLPL
ncbi:DNA-binding Lrp family transcriptional regulator [Mesocricetibacter intestinalis]|uniref:DNA-binding Lrp family transcriptional regulator n=1 Tax=Mesocricetibacter intestinalis TaxID=1521930 RepID=A0A4R6V813_9PAST|nr:Lrp/AsnC family transcriptional regulator [Mesocricetibacter intestinalis]TDQ57625.1 DNA-binding Lrp family transcriptional regulator [Mesocricetibacter intestinalis]